MTQDTPMTIGLAPESCQTPSHSNATVPTPSHHESITAPLSISPLPVPSTAQPPPPAENPLFNPPTQSIIAEEDPQRSIEIPEDDEDEATGDGLGEEDGNPDDDGDGDFDEGSEFDNKGTAGQAKPSPRPLPPWLLEPFKARVAESSSQYRDAAGLPPLYAQHQTFWFPQPSTYFLIKKGSTPQQLFNPLFFLWDPEALCPDGISCPNCRRVLHRHQAISQPRRCGIDQTFWIIGYRYRCRNCVHPKTKKTTVTFGSWDQRILAVLPPALSAEFPARLSHQSAISTTLFSWTRMRSSFNYGMGSKQFADALRMQHVLRYDMMELQYLNHIASFALDRWLGQKSQLL
jgi:hypothetical protein